MNELLIHNAKEKLEREAKSVTVQDVATMIQSEVSKALLEFCKQDGKLAEAIIKSDKTVYDCCKEITKDTKAAQYISDFIAFSRAVKFYLPDADIKFNMEIIRQNNARTEISLMDLLNMED